MSSMHARLVAAVAIGAVVAGCSSQPAQTDGLPRLPRGACTLTPAVKVAVPLEHPRIAQTPGYVILRTDVLADGAPLNTSVYASAPGSLYVDAATQTLAHTRFRPSDAGHVGCYMTYTFKPGDEF